MKFYGLSLAVIALCLRAASPAPAHAVTMRFESFTKDTVVVHITTTPAGIQLSSDTTNFVQSLRIVTPADVRVSSAANRVTIATEGDVAVRVRLTDGASAAERALKPWGRRLAFVRVNGDLEPQAQAELIKPTPNGR